jgi:hypothetical protein
MCGPKSKDGNRWTASEHSSRCSCCTALEGYKTMA